MPPIAKVSSWSTLVEPTNRFDFDSEIYKVIPVNGASKKKFPLEDTIELFQTRIVLPHHDKAKVEYMLPKDCIHGDQFFLPVEQNLASTDYLYLPRSRDGKIAIPNAPVDRFLESIPALQSTADRLLSEPPKKLSTACFGRVLNVHQGEVAHASSSQVDYVASMNATTCHIFALRSMSNRAEPLTSIAHIDRAGYECSIRSMFHEHRNHHDIVTESLKNNGYELERNDGSINRHVLELDLHIMGGFDDADGSSREITDFLFNLFPRIADELSSDIVVTLRTCAVSCMNDDGMNCPIGRGIAMNTVTGDIFLASIPSCDLNEVSGPAIDLRSARLWWDNKDALSIIHTSSSNGCIVIEPFRFEEFGDLKIFLQLPDEELLEYTSTSPQVESDNFCDSVRSSLLYIKRHNWEEVFGRNCDKPMIYARTSTQGANTWVLLQNL